MVPLLRQIIQRVPSTSWHVESEVSVGCQLEKLAKKLKKYKANSYKEWGSNIQYTGGNRGDKRSRLNHSLTL